MRGPGESQLETDRRLIGKRIKLLQDKLSKVSRQRHQSRISRQKAAVPSVSLVGYTNAGKSTLFNKITGAGVYAQNQLFATLDPTLRQLILPNKQEIVLADTVGFIRDLPHDLVAAFRSTLQETEEATLLLHVVDISGEEREMNMSEVDSVLSLIGADVVPQIVVYNKIDATDIQPYCRYDENGMINAIYLSAKSGLGIDLLIEALQQHLQQSSFVATITLVATEAKLRARMYKMGIVLEESIDEKGNWILNARFNNEIKGKLDIQDSRLDMT